MASCTIPLSKYKGCLFGALIGDCTGSPFEYISADPDIQVLHNFFDDLNQGRRPSESMKYTDDTAMTKCIAQSLITEGKLDEKDLAKRFVDEFFSNIRLQREYGVHVREVFVKLREENFADPLKPAKEQFGGTGSYGNGGAMRIAPVALFYHSDMNLMIQVAKQVTKITHTNILGVNGAVLQCLAVHQALTLDPSQGPLDIYSFLENLIAKMQTLEKAGSIEKDTEYHAKLQAVRKLLSKKEGAEKHEVQASLGNNVSAHGSVPIAIYSFLRAQNPIPNILTSNKFQRTVQYSISLGGDTDTIGTMAGAIAGAYFGDGEIVDSLKRSCKGFDEVQKLADGIANRHSC